MIGVEGPKVEAINSIDLSHLLTVGLAWRAEPANDT